MTDRAHLLRERLGPGWSFEIGWLAGIKEWTVRIWNEATKRRLIHIDKSAKDLDEACKLALKEVKRATEAAGWTAVAKALKDEAAGVSSEEPIEKETPT